MVKYAPVLLFTYNRPSHTQRTIMALAANYLATESDLYIFSDAPKNEAAAEEVKQVRNFIKTVKGFKTINIVERENNFGLVKSITEGVTNIIDNYGRVIVVEDDLITHPQFLNYMNMALDEFEQHNNVYEITGYSHIKNRGHVLKNASYFLKITSTWGWATWANRWNVFSEGLKGSEVLLGNNKSKYLFNYDNSYNYYRMLKDTKSGKVRSWGIVWYWNIFKHGGLTLYPTHTLVDQIGFDGSGQNGRNYVVNSSRIQPIDYEFIFPAIIEEKSKYRKFVSWILRTRKFSIIWNMGKYAAKLLYHQKNDL